MLNESEVNTLAGVAGGWTDYEIIATGGGEKLERWGKLVLLRPDPQAIWQPPFKLDEYKGINARYIRSHSGGGRWEYKGKVPEEFVIGRADLKFCCKLMGFKHTGLFPEQAYNWDRMRSLIEGAGRQIRVLNLFAYTGGATVACAKSGAHVTHVDAAKAMVERAKKNAELSGVSRECTRYIVDDCAAFVAREIRRGNKYDAVIMDPPSYGRGPSGEVWRTEDDLYSFAIQTAKILSEMPLFVLINSYTTGLQPTVIANILALTMPAGGEVSAYELALPTGDRRVNLPCGCSGLITYES